MANRYANAKPFINTNDLYEEFFEERDVNYIEQYRTGILTQPSKAQRARLQTIKHVWGMGDRLYKLAYKHYGDSTAWWIIAWYNLKPTESHFKEGDLVYIPLPLNRVMGLLQRL